MQCAVIHGRGEARVLLDAVLGFQVNQEAGAMVITFDESILDPTLAFNLSALQFYDNITNSFYPMRSILSLPFPFLSQATPKTAALLLAPSLFLSMAFLLPFSTSSAITGNFPGTIQQGGIPGGANTSTGGNGAPSQFTSAASGGGPGSNMSFGGSSGAPSGTSSVGFGGSGNGAPPAFASGGSGGVPPSFGSSFSLGSQPPTMGSSGGMTVTMESLRTTGKAFPLSSFSLFPAAGFLLNRTTGESLLKNAATAIRVSIAVLRKLLHACVRACMHACVCVCVCKCVHVCMCLCAFEIDGCGLGPTALQL
jgi:hypothetical protein